jgi:hypothetical protein
MMPVEVTGLVVCSRSIGSPSSELRLMNISGVRRLSGQSYPVMWLNVV